MLTSTDNLQPGATVYADLGTAQRPNLYLGRVTRRTPSGCIDVEFGDMWRRFGPNAWERGKSYRTAGRLISEREYQRLINLERFNVVRDKLAKLAAQPITCDNALTVADQLDALALALR